MKPTALLRLYRGLMRAASPLLPLYLKRRAAKGKEDPARLNERYGTVSRPRPDGKLIWIHGASVGETLMALPIVEWIVENDETAHVLVTSGTVTSAELLITRLPARATHQYLPADTPAYADKFLNHWQPNLSLWLESDIWPNILRATKARDIPMLLLNARLSEKSRKGWAKRPKTAKALFNAFDDVLPADDETAEFISDVLGRHVKTFGNLKNLSPPLPVDENLLQTYREQIKNRRVWCAASTHKGEENILISGYIRRKNTLRGSDPHNEFSKSLMIFAPRHPERCEGLIEWMTKRGINYARLGEAITEKTEILLIDKIGYLGLAYRLSTIVFMGGSLLPHLKGHNPLEAAQLDNVILTGSYVDSFKTIYTKMHLAGAVDILPEGFISPTFSGSIIKYWDDETLRKQTIGAARNFVSHDDKMALQLFARLDPFLSALNKVG